MACTLEKPLLSPKTFGGIPVLTDDALASSVGVRVAFTGREGGVSRGPYSSLNLASHVSDVLDDVLENRARVARAFSVDPALIVVPNQVHGSDIVTVSSSDPDYVDKKREAASLGADALVVEARNVGALLCSADCAPVVIVSPTGRFAIAHAGWRGAFARITGKTLRALSELDRAGGVEDTLSEMNVYIGPHIRVECFETGAEVRDRFADRFGEGCVAGNCVNLAQVITTDALESGVREERIVVAPYCTRCNPEAYFSYRASGGTTGRNGAFAVRL